MMCRPICRTDGSDKRYVVGNSEHLTYTRNLALGRPRDFVLPHVYVLFSTYNFNRHSGILGACCMSYANKN